MSLARGGVPAGRGLWPRGTFRLERGRWAPAWKPLRGFAPCGCWRYHRGHDLKPTRRSRELGGPVGRPVVLAGVRTPVAVRGAGREVSVGSRVPDSLARGAWQDRHRVREPDHGLHREESDPGREVREGGCEGGDRPEVFP